MEWSWYWMNECFQLRRYDREAGVQECKNQTNVDKWRNILHCATIKFILRHKADSVTLFQIKDWIKIIKEFPWSVQIYLDCELWCLNFDNTGYIGRDSGRKKRVKVGVGGESWGYIRISQYQIKKNSSVQHCVPFLQYCSSSNILIDLKLIKNMWCVKELI